MNGFDMNHPALAGLSRRAKYRRIREMLRRGPGVNAVQYAGNLSADTHRGPSPAVWSGFPWEELVADPSKGMTFFDDFLMAGSMGSATGAAAVGNIGQWGIYGDQGALASDGQLEGGVLKLAADGSDENITIMGTAGSFRMVTTSTLAANQELRFEARVARSTITTQHMEAFVGLCTPSMTSSLPTANIPLGDTDDALSTTPSFFGFHLAGLTATRGGPTEVSIAFELASGTVNFPTNLTTLMASTGNTVLANNAFVKLGFIFDPFNGPFKRITSATARQTAGQTKRAMLRVFVNNIEAPAFLTSDDILNATAAQAFPTGFMAPCISMGAQSAVSADSLLADWIRVGQRANS